MLSGLRIQYGCGLLAPDGWRNFDASPTLRLQRLPVVGRLLSSRRVVFPKNVEYGDIAQHLPLSDDCAQAMYCSHVLEHLSLGEFRHAIRETYRILMPRGIFRGVLPDLERYIDDYKNDQSASAARTFMSASLLGEETRPRGLVGLASTIFGNHQHRWMWDYKALANELEVAGFVEIRRAEIGDQYAEVFGGIEEPSRWNGCLGFQCQKPIDLDS